MHTKQLKWSACEELQPTVFGVVLSKVSSSWAVILREVQPWYRLTKRVPASVKATEGPTTRQTASYYSGCAAALLVNEKKKKIQRESSVRRCNGTYCVRKYGIHHDNAAHPPLRLRCHTCLQCTLYKARHTEDGWTAKLLQSSSLYVTEKSSITRKARDGKLEARHVMSPCLLS